MRQATVSNWQRPTGTTTSSLPVVKRERNRPQKKKPSDGAHKQRLTARHRATPTFPRRRWWVRQRRYKLPNEVNMYVDQSTCEETTCITPPGKKQRNDSSGTLGMIVPIARDPEGRISSRRNKTKLFGREISARIIYRIYNIDQPATKETTSTVPLKP